MLEAFFVLSAACTILFVFSISSGKYIPVPLLHYWYIGFNHSMLYTPAIIFQVWYWSKHFNLI